MGETKWRSEPTDVEESADELWLGVTLSASAAMMWLLELEGCGPHVVGGTGGEGVGRLRGGTGRLWPTRSKRGTRIFGTLGQVVKGDEEFARVVFRHAVQPEPMLRWLTEEEVAKGGQGASSIR